MNEPQARAIVEQVSRDYAGVIRATIERSKKAPKTGGGCRVALTLIAEQRRFLLTYTCQLPKALEAWQVYLLSEEEQARMIAAAPIQDNEDELESEAS